MNIFNGRDKSIMLDAKILEHLSGGAATGELAIILIGDNEASEKYISIKKKYCDSKGIKCGIYRFDERLKDEEIFKKVFEVLSSPSTAGGIIQLPLPRPSLDPCLRLIPAEKDIDAISPFSMEAFYARRPHKILPVIRALDLFVTETGKDPTTAPLRAVVIGEGYLVGKPTAYYLKSKNYQVTVLNDYQTGQKIDADLLLLSAGIPELVRGEDVSAGCDVVDFGSSIKDGKTTGDLVQNSSLEHLGLVSMSPGGVGPLVVRYLIMNFLGI